MQLVGMLSTKPSSTLNNQITFFLKKKRPILRTLFLSISVVRILSDYKWLAVKFCSHEVISFVHKLERKERLL